MSKQNLSEEEFKETLKHIVFSLGYGFNVKRFSNDDLDRASIELKDILETDSDVKPMLRVLFREGKKYEERRSKVVHKLMSITKHIWICEYCVYLLKWRLKKVNSLTLPVIKGCLMRKEPDLLNLNKIAGGVRDLFAYQKTVLKRMIEREEMKLKSLKGVKKKKKDNLKSLFFKKRGDLKSSLVQKGRKNADCMLRGYEMSVLKEPSKTGKIPTCQGDVANALVNEGLADRCSQQSVSRWNAIVKKELNRLSG